MARPPEAYGLQLKPAPPTPADFGLTDAEVNVFRQHRGLFSFLNAQVRAIAHKKDSYKKYKKDAERYALAAYRGRTEYWLALSPRAFEIEVSRIFQAIGYATALTARSGDKGIDIMMQRDGRDFIVQCKANNSLASAKVVRELYGTLTASGAHHAFLATLRGCTSDAAAWANGKPLTILNARDFANAELESLAPHVGLDYLPGTRLLWSAP
jgi:hypothetical protein